MKLLFADDEKSLQSLMSLELPRMGHEVTVCPDGKAAVKALEKGTYDAAILDLRMPGLSGIEVLEQIKQVSPETEVVIMTGHASIETAIEAVRLGAFDYITKPAKLAQLETILRDHVQDEETEQFPGLRAQVPREELVEMAQKVEAAKKVAPTRPHPLAPNNPVFHKLVGPGVGLVDRLRDRLTKRNA